MVSLIYALMQYNRCYSCYQNICQFRVAKVVAPKKEALKAAEAELAVAMGVSLQWFLRCGTIPKFKDLT